MIAHHPDEALLLAHASGAADEATSLIVATHLHYCAGCRIKAAEMENIGGSLLEDLQPSLWRRAHWKQPWRNWTR